MEQQAKRVCSVCGGRTVGGVILDHDDLTDFQSCFAIEGDTTGFLTPAYPSQHRIKVSACLVCGHLDHYVNPEDIQQRLSALGWESE